MTGVATIQSLRTRARLYCDAHDRTAARLVRVVRQDLPGHLKDHLGELAPADRRVVLIRKLKVRGRLAGHLTDKELAGAWATLLADGILSAAEACYKPDDVRIFTDKADWIAACICDVLARGVAQAPWWYGPLGRITAKMSTSQALVHLLEHEHAQIFPVLARIDERGALDSLFDALSPEDREFVLCFAARPGERDAAARDRLRPVLGAALEMLDLDRTPSKLEALMSEWIAQNDVVDPDWRSPSALADAVLAACQFLVQTGRVDRRRLNAGARRPAPAWLDRERLRRGLAAGDAATEIAALDAISAAIQSAIAGSGGDPNRLILTALARLASRQSSLAASARTRTLLQLSAPLALRLAALPAADRASALEAYRNGKGPLFEKAGDADEAALRSKVTSILQAIVAPPARPAGEPAGRGCVSACAGVAVMLRAVTDFDLAGALATARLSAPSLPEFPGVIAAALLCAWAGPDSAQADGRLDAGIALLLGDRVPNNVADLAAALARIEPSAIDALACAVDRVIAAQNPAASREVAESDLAALAGSTALPFDPLIPRISARLLTHWSRWLTGFDRSSCVWLLEHAVRRRGRIAAAGEGMVVHMPPLPLDIPLRRAGYLDPLTPPDWLPWSRIAFQVNDGAG